MLEIYKNEIEVMIIIYDCYLWQKSLCVLLYREYSMLLRPDFHPKLP